jgi:hypothetical protein
MLPPYPTPASSIFWTGILFWFSPGSAPQFETTPGFAGGPRLAAPVTPLKFPKLTYDNLDGSGLILSEEDTVTLGRIERGQISRQSFLRLGGAGLAGAALLTSPARAFAQSDAGRYIEYREHTPGGLSGGTFTSEVFTASIDFDTLIPSWNARIPSGSAVKVEIRVRYGGRWSGWLSLGSYAVTDRSASESTAYPNWRVDVDTVQSRNGELANAYQYRLSVSGSPRVSRIAIMASQSARHGEKINAGNLERTWGKRLNVPLRSQYDFDAGAAWCSPTSVSMVTTYWGNLYDRSAWKRTVPATARGVYDAGARIWGNWPFSTAYPAHLGLASSVSRFNDLQQAERWIDAGIPVIASVAWDNRYSDRLLDNASIPRATYGHLLVIVGFTGSGDVIVNDPAASPRSQVRRVYDRAQFRRAWLDSDRWRGGRSDGVVYFIRPPNKSIPSSWAANGSW